MKKLFFVLLSAALVWSCQKQPADQISLSGTISHADSLEIRYVEGQNADTISLAADGTFTYLKVSDKPARGYLNVGKKYVMVYLIPGKDLIVTADYPNWDSTLVFGGRLKPVTDYLGDKTKIMRQWSKNFMSTVVKDPEAYRMSRDSLAGSYQDLVNRYETMKDFDAGFAKQENLSIQFEKIMDLKNYSMMHRYYAKKDTVILPDNWNDFEKDIDLTDPLLTQVPAAMQYLTNYVTEHAQEEAGLMGDVWGKPELLAAKFAFIRKTFTSPEMVESLMYNDLGQQIDGAGTKGIDEQLNMYFSLAKDQKQIGEIKKKAAEWDGILPGKPAPDFTVVDILGKEFTLAQFRGKYVYIDFWATWCGPCKQEIPFLKKLHEDFQKKNIVIMSISVDQDKKAWEKMVTEEGFAWLQLHDGNKINDRYVVRYIPSFILIDREGKIIDPRAPNPSDPKLRELIGTLTGL